MRSEATSHRVLKAHRLTESLHFICSIMKGPWKALSSKTMGSDLHFKMIILVAVWRIELERMRVGTGEC